jgi:hypothetical protein
MGIDAAEVSRGSDAFESYSLNGKPLKVVMQEMDKSARHQ